MTGIWLGLVAAVVATSMLSGVFGMAGGMLLMGLMAWLLPVAQAMVLHGTAQVVANGWRAWLNRRDIDWRVVARYLVGVGASVGLFLVVAFSPPKPLVFLLMGLVPFSQLVVPKGLLLDITRRGQAQTCGFLVNSIQLVAGVAGPLLDVFFVRTNLTRHQVVATKAVCAATGHIGKLVYFGALLGGGTAGLPAWLPGALIVAAILGTALGKRVLDGLTDTGFRRWSRVIILALGAVYLAQAAWLMLWPAG
ncbi:MAG: sulfite exporter TauE/SafE family protein [Geminicoccaceae bacterium]